MALITQDDVSITCRDPAERHSRNRSSANFTRLVIPRLRLHCESLAVVLFALEWNEKTVPTAHGKPAAESFAANHSRNPSITLLASRYERRQCVEHRNAASHELQLTKPRFFFRGHTCRPSNEKELSYR